MGSVYVSENSKEYELLRKVCEWEWDEDGNDIDGMIEDVALSSVQPGICTDSDCTAITSRVEPDQDAGWCHNCEKNTVKSVGVLSGLC